MTEFEKIYETYFHDVFLYMKCLSGDEKVAEEITSETFFKAMKSLNTFKGNCDIRVWLCQIAKNTFYTSIKKNSKFEEFKDENITVTPINFIEKFMDDEAELRIHTILHQLDEPYKEVFHLRLFGELSFSKIASIFGKSENWACVTYHRAKCKIQKELEGFYND